MMHWSGAPGNLMFEVMSILVLHVSLCMTELLTVQGNPMALQLERAAKTSRSPLVINSRPAEHSLAADSCQVEPKQEHR
jgi:hypothetical protein